MATVSQMLKYIEDTKPHAFSEDTLIVWLNEIEGRIHHDIFDKTDYEELSPDEPDRVLAAPAPHTAVYWTWLYAMIDFAAEDYSNYQNDMQLFNAAWDAYAKWVQRNKNRGCNCR